MTVRETVTLNRAKMYTTTAISATTLARAVAAELECTQYSTDIDTACQLLLKAARAMQGRLDELVEMETKMQSKKSE